ncbi:MAG: YodL domain-containing protein [Lachnospiraceae bacterium]|nr:YodL domain-containing protein [Lachnospiraceae bacterium]
MSESRYTIYQLKQSIENSDRAYMPLKYLREKDIPVQRERYDLTYQASLKDEILDDLYLKFNLYHPADFTGHSMSISDVIVLQKDGIRTAFYVDDMGFAEVPEFFRAGRRIIYGKLETEKHPIL